MTDISSGFLDPGDNKNADRTDLPMTQVDDDEVEAHRGDAVEAPTGEGTGIGIGIGGEPTRLPADDGGQDDTSSADARGGGAATMKPDGLGSEGTIPNVPGGIGVGAGARTTFEPEEDREAARQRDTRSTP